MPSRQAHRGLLRPLSRRTLPSMLLRSRRSEAPRPCQGWSHTDCRPGRTSSVRECLVHQRQPSRRRHRMLRWRRRTSRPRCRRSCPRRDHRRARTPRRMDVSGLLMRTYPTRRRWSRRSGRPGYRPSRRHKGCHRGRRRCLRLLAGHSLPPPRTRRVAAMCRRHSERHCRRVHRSRRCLHPGRSRLQWDRRRSPRSARTRRRHRIGRWCRRRSWGRSVRSGDTSRPRRPQRRGCCR